MKIKIVSLLIMLICSCNDNHPNAPYGAGQTFYYKSYDLNHHLIAQGVIKIKFNNSDEISGTWNLQKIGNPQNIGPQSGTGELVGDLINKDSIWIELNPQFKDNNLQLLAKYTRTVLTGKWLWITYAGITNQGYFNATLN